MQNLEQDIQPAMTFEQIAAHFGVSRMAVWYSYSNGMKKLRRNAQALEVIRALLYERERERCKKSIF